MPGPVRIIVASDAFKDCMTNAEACHAITRGLRVRARMSGLHLEIIERPLSDGGAGFVEALCAGAEHQRITRQVCGPLVEPVSASFALLDRPNGPTAVLQLSDAAGLSLAPTHKRSPEQTTTYGVGELIGAAIDAGAREILLGIGNSATCDGGAGLLAALGARILDDSGQAIERPTGADLIRIARIDAALLAPRVSGVRFTVACDVTNPLYGPSGSAHVFAPQKGAKPDQVARLDAGLRNFARRVAEAGFAFSPDTAGAGAAGGVSFGLASLCGASLTPGAELVLDALGFDDLLKGARLMITGEGRFDATSLSGKAAFAAGRRAQRAGVKAIALVGSTGGGWEQGIVGHGGPFQKIVPITPVGMPHEAALKNAPRLLQDAASDQTGLRNVFGVSPF